MLTKEKSNQKRKCVNNQNNSASYFRLCNTLIHHQHNKTYIWEQVVGKKGVPKSCI